MADHPTLSLIVPAKNQADLTRLCVDSLRLYTSLSYELILIDDGSDPPLREQLPLEGITVIRHEQAQGWIKSCNAGIAQATGDYMALINNDTVVTPRWDQKMLAHFTAYPTLGVLGPVSSKVEGRQSVDFNQEGVAFEFADWLQFFFAVIRRSCLDKVGTLDERFGLGGQDDADFCWRAKQAGFEVGIARDVYVYHYGSATFREELKYNIPASQQLASRQQVLLDQKHRRFVMVCVPTLGSLRAELVRILLAWRSTPQINLMFYFPVGMLPLDNARNHCVSKFMELSNHPDDRLLFLDDDIVPPISGLDTLLQHDQNVVGLLCFMLKPDDHGNLIPVPVALRYNGSQRYQVYFEGDGLTEVDAIGGGCIMVKRRVYEAIGGRPYTFHYYPDGTLNLVGDFDFCQQAQAAGFSIFVDYAALCGHVKPVDLRAINQTLVEATHGERH